MKIANEKTGNFSCLNCRKWSFSVKNRTFFENFRRKVLVLRKYYISLQRQNTYLLTNQTTKL